MSSTRCTAKTQKLSIYCHSLSDTDVVTRHTTKTIAVYNHHCIQPSLYTTITVYNHCGIQPSLNTTITVYNHHCIQPLLYTTITEYNHHCIQPSLYTTITVYNHHCIVPQAYHTYMQTYWDSYTFKHTGTATQSIIHW